MSKDKVQDINKDDTFEYIDYPSTSRTYYPNPFTDEDEIMPEYRNDFYNAILTDGFLDNALFDNYINHHLNLTSETEAHNNEDLAAISLASAQGVSNASAISSPPPATLDVQPSAEEPSLANTDRAPSLTNRILQTTESHENELVETRVHILESEVNTLQSQVNDLMAENQNLKVQNDASQKHLLAMSLQVKEQDFEIDRKMKIIQSFEDSERGVPSNYRDINYAEISRTLRQLYTGRNYADNYGINIGGSSSGANSHALAADQSMGPLSFPSTGNAQNPSMTNVVSSGSLGGAYNTITTSERALVIQPAAGSSYTDQDQEMLDVNDIDFNAPLNLTPSNISWPSHASDDQEGQSG